MASAPAHPGLVKATLLLASSMTVMAGAIISPGLADIGRHFADQPALMIQLVLTMPGLMIALFSPLAGYLIDALGRRRMLLASLALAGAAGTAGYVVDGLAALLVTRALLGVAVGGIMSATITLGGDYFQADERARFMGMQGSMMALAAVVFLNVGGVLAEWSWRGPFLVYLFAFAVLPLAAAVLHEPSRGTGADEDGGIDGAPVDALRTGGIYLLAFLGMLVLYIVPTQLPFLVAHDLGGGSRAVAIAISATTLASAAASFAYARVKGGHSHRAIHAASFVLIAVGFTVIGLAQHFAAVLVGVTIAGLGFGLFMPNGSLWLMSITPERARGRVVGGFSSMMFLGQFMAPVFSAPAVALWGFSGAFLAMAALCVLITVLLPLVAARHRDSQAGVI